MSKDAEAFSGNRQTVSRRKPINFNPATNILEVPQPASLEQHARPRTCGLARVHSGACECSSTHTYRVAPGGKRADRDTCLPAYLQSHADPLEEEYDVSCEERCTLFKDMLYFVGASRCERLGTKRLRSIQTI